VIDFFSLSAVIGDRIFCAHGGLSPCIFKIDNIKTDKVLANSPASDLVWSDPSENKGWVISQRFWFLYGPDVISNFLHANSRAHQLCMNGYSWNNDHTVITVWSAQNYCYRCGNVAAIAEINQDMTLNIKTFNATPANDRGAPYRMASIFFED